MEPKIDLETFLDSIFAKVGNRFSKESLLDFATAELLLSEGLITSLDYLVLTGQYSGEQASSLLSFEDI